MNLTKPQQLIYDMERFAGGTIAVICGSILMEGKVDTYKLKYAVNEIYRLNDALRIRISDTDGVSQTISEYRALDIPVLTFNTKAEFTAFAEDYAKQPVNTEKSLCEMQIVVLPEQCGVLIKLHHLIGDAWTLSLLGNQLNRILGDEPVEAFLYADYVEAEKAYMQNRRYEKDKAFFIEQFKKCDEVTYLSEKMSADYTANRKTIFYKGIMPSEKVLDFPVDCNTLTGSVNL